MQNQNNPYLLWAGEPSRYVFQWNAGQGGVLPAQAYQARVPTTSSLGAADMLESGYGDPNFIPNPALRKVAPFRYCPPPPAPCGLRANAAAELAGLGAATVEYPQSILAQIGSAIVGGIDHTFGGKPRVASTMGPRGRNSRMVEATGDWPQVRPQGFEPGWMATGSIPVWDDLSNTGKTVLLAAIGAGALWWLTKKKRRKNPWAVTARHARGVTGTVRFRSKKFAYSYADDLRKSKKHSRVRVTRY